MPTYLYAIVNPDGSDGETFEHVQSMRDDPLTEHPETGQPVRRVITAPHIGGAHSEAREKRQLSDGNLDKLGFTKYVKSGSGYDKVAGKGPDLSQINKIADSRGLSE